MIDCSHLSIKPKSDSLGDDFQRLKQLLERFYLRKATCFSLKEGESVFSFPNYKTKEEAAEALGIRELVNRKVDKDDFRSLLSFDNHFKDGTVELSFLSDVHIKEKKDLQVLCFGIQHGIF